MPEVVVGGYYGAGNFGDEVVLRGVLEELRSANPEVSVTVVSHDPAATTALHGVRAVGRARAPSVLAAIWNADLLLLGGGGLLQDRTSLRSPLYYLALMRVAQALDRPVAAYAQGFGPIRRRIVARASARALSRCAYVSVRDAGSRDELVALGVAADAVALTCDAGLRHLARRRDEHLARGSAARGRLLRGGARALSVWVPRARSPHDVFAAAALRVRAALRAVPLFLPLSPEDAPVCAKIADAAGAGRALPHQAEPARTVEWIAAADVVVTSRLHAAVAACLFGAGVVGVSDDPKLSRFLAAVGCACLPGDAGPDRIASAARASARGRARERTAQRTCLLSTLGGPDQAFLREALSA